MPYSTTFIKGIHLNFPALTTDQKKELAPLLNSPHSFELGYTHFSVFMNKERKLAFFAATNIDGKKWNAAVTDRIVFKTDDRIDAKFQTGDELYDFYKNKSNNDFDKGHIAKFQDPQWGDSDDIIKKAADDSMHYTNCMPQHHSLNRGAWKSLEDYIIKKFTNKSIPDGQKISVFAGPVLSPRDPFYVDQIASSAYQVACHFWKVIIYHNRDGKLTAVGFIMSQEKILRKYGFIVDTRSDVHPSHLAAAAALPDFFTDFKKGEPYQVRIDFIEKVTGLKFDLTGVNQPFTKVEAQELIYKRIEVGKAVGFTATSYADAPLDFKFLKGTF